MFGGERSEQGRGSEGKGFVDDGKRHYGIRLVGGRSGRYMGKVAIPTV